MRYARVHNVLTNFSRLVEMQEVRLALREHVILERDSVEGDIVLIDSKSGRMSACNETASCMVARLEAGSSVAGLVDTLVSAFAVTHEVAIRDVNAFLDVLAAEGLLETLE